ncbi:MAG: alkyl/aryl-sulfatase [Anaerovoracaceae bacterium]
MDPLTAQETAAEALKFINKTLKKDLKVSAVIYTHSHVDHYAGVKGVADKNTKIYAPDGFMDAVANENLYAGVAMERRAFFMYGTILPPGVKGQVDGGLGKIAANGTQSLMKPDITIKKPVEKLTVDGLPVEFQLTNGTEAPSEMNVYFPSKKSFCAAENCTATLHNLYTLRGAQVRDPELWANYIDDAVSMYGDKSTSLFSTHNWPRFADEIVPYMESQRDCYQFIKDQTLRLMSQGYTIEEVGSMIELPRALSQNFFNGEFYGTVSHNAKAVYQKYLGWYDSNPVNLDKLIPEDSAKKYVEYMGGADKVLKLAKKDFDKGEYKWVAEVTKQIIYADPKNEEARLLCADALEQLGYIAESGPWRNEYLYGAKELRDGVHLPGKGINIKKDVYDALNEKQFAAMLGIRLNAEKAEKNNMKFSINVDNMKLNFHLRNGVLVHVDKKVKTDFAVNMDKESFYLLVSGGEGQMNYTVNPSGKKKDFDKFLRMLDKANPQFNIVTP